MTDPSPIPTPAERFAEAIRNIELAMKADADDATLKKMVYELGVMAWNISDKIKKGLGSTT